jgi:hypothetical protein
MTGFGRTHTRGDLWAYRDASVPIDPPPDAAVIQIGVLL